MELAAFLSSAFSLASFLSPAFSLAAFLSSAVSSMLTRATCWLCNRNRNRADTAGSGTPSTAVLAWFSAV